MNIHSLVPTLAWTAGLLLLAAACGTKKSEEVAVGGPIRVSWPVSDREGLPDADLPPFELEEDVSFLGSGRFNSVFWLDFDGARVTSQDSFIVRNAGRSEVVIPPFVPSDIRSSEGRENLKLSLIQELESYFPDVDIRLTLTRPSAGVFSRVHIGGSNFTQTPRVLGIAPLDLGNRIGNDVLFVYSRDIQRLGDAETVRKELLHVIAHEIAHALGARHIDSNRALMKPSVAFEADRFNITAPVVDTPNELENSLQVLVNSAGSRRLARNEQGLPQLVDLAAFATGGIIQYSVISRNNMQANPGLRLGEFRYEWEFEGQRSEGTSVLMNFDDRGDHLLNLTVSDAEGNRRSFQFLVGRRK